MEDAAKHYGLFFLLREVLGTQKSWKESETFRKSENVFLKKQSPFLDWSVCRDVQADRCTPFERFDAQCWFCLEQIKVLYFFYWLECWLTACQMVSPQLFGNEKLTKLSGDQRGHGVLAHLRHGIKIGLSSQGHCCTGRENTSWRDSARRPCVGTFRRRRLQKQLRKRLLKSIITVINKSAITCDRLLVALAEVDQVLQARVELIHHNLGHRKGDVRHSFAYGI